MFDSQIIIKVKHCLFPVSVVSIWSCVWNKGTSSAVVFSTFFNKLRRPQRHCGINLIEGKASKCADETTTHWPHLHRGRLYGNDDLSLKIRECPFKGKGKTAAKNSHCLTILPTEFAREGCITMPPRRHFATGHVWSSGEPRFCTTVLMLGSHVLTSSTKGVYGSFRWTPLRKK